MELESTQTIGEIAAGYPATTRLFEKLGIDYCCGGGQTLADACKAAGLNYGEIAKSLADLAESAPTGERDWTKSSLTGLVGHIVTKHHEYIRSESPRLQALLAKVVGVHGGRRPELQQVETIFSDVADELAMHMMKEENILFPAIVRMEEEGRMAAAASPFGSIQNPIRMMMMEHDSAGAAFVEMRKITAGFTTPADGCISYRTLYQALAEFEADLHQHVHLENNILFPRALEMEGR
jgi:regulator of cell morphogenesis and NO signaling